MSHARQQIRDAAQSVLLGLTTTGTRVLIGRTRPLEKDHQPTLLIYTPQESSRSLNVGRPSTLLRTLTLAVEGRVSQGEPPDEILDTIAAEVEAAIAADPTLGKLVKNTVLNATTIQTDARGDVHQGAIRLSFEVTYATKETTPQSAV